LAETPRINSGKTPVVMHLLSPGFKPVQVTSDLHSFWNNTYIEVKNELKRRYPKHSWPDDPWNAPPVAKGSHRKSS
ncbi:MAG: ATP-dependent helicase C-terminal domain-containing protein, partial [Bacteroidota bacterium]